jgi:DNA-directed RNA polymerase subunit K/omega
VWARSYAGCLMAEERRITVFERARLIGARALQISQGAPLMVKLSTEELEKLKYNPVEIAKREYNEGVLPIVIKRR